MASDLKSSSSADKNPAADTPKKGVGQNEWVKVGAVAAASAVLGGLAAAWFYRKTLSQLRDAENEIPDSESRFTEDGTEEDF